MQFSVIKKNFTTITKHIELLTNQAWKFLYAFTYKYKFTYILKTITIAFISQCCEIWLQLYFLHHIILCVYSCITKQAFMIDIFPSLLSSVYSSFPRLPDFLSLLFPLLLFLHLLLFYFLLLCLILYSCLCLFTSSNYVSLPASLSLYSSVSVGVFRILCLTDFPNVR